MKIANRGFIGRWDGKELRQSTMAEFFKICPHQMIDKRNDQQGLLRFKPQYGGSEILYGDLKEDVVGPNLGWFWIDQAEEVEEQRWNALVGRLRKQTPMPQTNGQPLQISNGVNWVDRRDIGSGAHHADSFPPTFGLPKGNGFKIHFD